MLEAKSYAKFCSQVASFKLGSEVAKTKFGTVFLDEPVVQLYLTSLRFGGGPEDGSNLTNARHKQALISTQVFPSFKHGSMLPCIKQHACSGPVELRAGTLAKRFTMLKAGLRDAGISAAALPSWAVARASMTKTMVTASMCREQQPHLAPAHVNGNKVARQQSSKAVKASFCMAASSFCAHHRHGIV